MQEREQHSSQEMLSCLGEAPSEAEEEGEKEEEEGLSGSGLLVAVTVVVVVEVIAVNEVENDLQECFGGVLEETKNDLIGQRMLPSFQSSHAASFAHSSLFSLSFLSFLSLLFLPSL